MQMTVSIPASTASSIASPAKRAGTKTMGRVRAGAVDRVGDGVEDGDALDLLAALAGRHAGDDLRAVALVPRGRGIGPRDR